jgi:hypothetical protein
MHEQDERFEQDGRPGGFSGLSTYAQRGSALQSPERIRARGTRRIRRRKAGQAALGTGAFAVVAGIGASLVLTGSGHGSGGSTLSVGATGPGTAAPSAVGPGSIGTDPNASGSPGTAGPSGPSSTFVAPLPGTTEVFGSAPGTSSASVGSSVGTSPSPGAGTTPTAGTPVTLSRDATNFNATFAGTNGHTVFYGLGDTAQQVQAALRNLGFTQINIESMTSDTIPQNDLIDIDNTGHTSVLGHSIKTGAPLIFIESSGPAVKG